MLRLSVLMLKRQARLIGAPTGAHLGIVQELGKTDEKADTIVFNTVFKINSKKFACRESSGRHRNARKMLTEQF